MSEMTFLGVFEGVEYESAIIPKLSFLKGGGGWWSVNRQLGKSPLNTSTKPIEYFIPLQQKFYF